MTPQPEAPVLGIIPYEDDPLMAVAWRDCLMWAATQTEILDAFSSETGLRLGTSPFDRMIDEATGFDAAIAKAFIDWFNENVWGDGP